MILNFKINELSCQLLTSSYICPLEWSIANEFFKFHVFSIQGPIASLQQNLLERSSYPRAQNLNIRRRLTKRISPCCHQYHVYRYLTIIDRLNLIYKFLNIFCNR